MASATLSREEYLAKATEEFERQRLAEEAEKRSRSEFASRVFTGFRYPELAHLHQQEGFGDLYDALGEHETNHLTLLRKQYGPSIDSIMMSPEKGTKDLGSHVLILKPDSQIRNIDVVISPKAPFSHTIVVPIEENEESARLSSMSHKEIRKTYGPAIAEILAELPSDSLSVGTVFDSTASHSYRDVDRWPTYFPKRKSQLGIYAHGGRFYFVATSHAGETGARDLATILESPQMSISQFVNDRRVLWIKQMAYRNCVRLVYEVAQRLKFSVPYGQDLAASYHDFIPPPRNAIPVLFSAHNTFGRDLRGNVICYHGCTDPRYGMSGMFVGSNAYHGFVHLQPTKSLAPGIHFYPAFTSRIHKRSRKSFKPSTHRKLLKRVHYVRESKHSRTTFSREVFNKSAYDRFSSAFGSPSTPGEEYVPVFVYVS
jgi:hypothetical protein